MAATGSLNLDVQHTALGVTDRQVIIATLAFTGNRRSDLIQNVDDTGAALDTGSGGTVGLLVAFVLTGTAAGTVSFYRDSGFTLPIASAVAQNQLGIIVANPAVSIYAKASTGATIAVRVKAFEV